MNIIHTEPPCPTETQITFTSDGKVSANEEDIDAGTAAGGV